MKRLLKWSWAPMGFGPAWFWTAARDASAMAAAYLRHLG